MLSYYIKYKINGVNMNSIYDELKNSLGEYSDILKVIDNKRKSTKYVKELLDKLDLPEADLTLEALNEKASYRMNHILFTFSLGILLAKFLELDQLITKEYSKYFKDEKNVFYKVWLMLSLYHDFGYFIQNKYKDCSKFDLIEVENNIFSFNSEKIQAMKLFGLPENEVMTRYDKKIYEKYYECYYKKNNEIEPVEHGIIGGYILFDEIIKNNQNVETKKRVNVKRGLEINENKVNDELIYQDICYRIMEHNIWAIDKTKDYFASFIIPELKPIFIENFNIIDSKEPLLMLLSLTDTIEYIKKLSATGLDNPNAQNRPTTLAKKILINISKNMIIIDVNGVVKIDGYNKWKDSIENINSWVDVYSIYENGQLVINSKV